MQVPQSLDIADDPSAAPEASEFGVLDMFLVLAESLRLLIVGPLLVGLAAFGLTYLITPSFTAKTVLLPPQQQQSSATLALQSLGALAGIGGGAAGLRNPADQYAALMQSNAVEDRIVERFKLMEVYEVKTKTDARRVLEVRTRFSPTKKDGLLTIEFEDQDPQRAAAVANAYVQELRHLTGRLTMTEAQQRRVFFEKYLQDTKEKLAAAQRALQAAGINEGAIRGEPKAAAEAYAKLQAEVVANEVRLETMRGYLTETSPDFTRAQSQLAALRAQLARREAVNAVGAQGDYVDRFREFKYQETLFDLFSRQYEVARLDESREGPLVQVVDAATAPERKSSPKRVVTAGLATLATATMLLIWVFAQNAWQRARRDGPTAGKMGMISEALRRSIGRSG
jgi:uncharacterized protein involved in exopolysaccharide biosynthesis